MSVRRLVVITGMSGSGKSVAVKSLEDLGFFCVDNLPIVMLSEFLDLVDERLQDLAVVIDIRQPGFFEAAEGMLESLKKRQDYQTQLLFLDCDDQTLSRRFAESRRPHPLNASSISEGLLQERQLLSPLRGEADLILDTSNLAPHELRQRLREDFSLTEKEAPLQVNIISFGFKYGTPLDAHFIMDMRFLPNPYWDKKLREMTGKDQPVIEFLEKLPETGEYLRQLLPMLSFMLRYFQKRDRQFFTIAVGCTGGQHRSVYVAERIHQYLKEEGFTTMIMHRDLTRNLVLKKEKNSSHSQSTLG